MELFKPKKMKYKVGQVVRHKLMSGKYMVIGWDTNYEYNLRTKTGEIINRINEAELI